MVDSVVTDPPYHLTSIVKRFGKPGSAPAQQGTDGRFARASRGFMGKQWDGGDIAFQPETWRLCFDLMKPGGHLVAFGGTRTHHRIWCAIEDAGFEVRDTLAWLYGSGFPKSHNAGDGWGTALKPAFEPIILARKPLAGTVAANVREHGTGAINVDGCRVATADDLNGGAYSGELRRRDEYTPTDCDGAVPLSRLNRGAGEYQQPSGRWPANVAHDGSEEVLQAFPESVSNSGGDRGVSQIWGSAHGNQPRGGHDDSGSAARFFYCAKADADDRIGSKHPTVKPVALMRWLVRLVTPKGGLVLDPFAGTGTTGVAAIREGMRAILIEREAEYHADIQTRIAKLSGADAPLFAASMPVCQLPSGAAPAP